MADKMKSTPLLLLRLEGPLQSWGERSKWDYRDTAPFPTKSGIAGMIGCVMGLERDDIRLGEMCHALRIGIRADRPGELITDFHTVSAEQIMNAKGEKRSGGNTIVTHRSYLQGASFLAVISLAEDAGAENAGLLLQIKSAFENPVWMPYLGRKSCVPSIPLLPIYTEQYGSIEEALRKAPAAKRAKYPLAAEIDSPDGSGYLRSDVRRVQSAYEFDSRRVTVLSIPEPLDAAE